MIRSAALASAFLFSACLNNPHDAPSISEAQIRDLAFELRLASYYRFQADRADTLPKTIGIADTLSRRILKDEQVDVYVLIGNIPRNVKLDVRVYSIESHNGVAEPIRLQSTASLNTCCGGKPGETRLQNQLGYFPNSTVTPYKKVLRVEIGGRERFRDSVEIL